MTRRIYFENRPFRVEVADSFVKRLRGLSGRKALDRDQGMLFTFGRNGRYGFWMYGMRFSIDIIWLDERGRIVHIWKNAKPCNSIIGCRSVKPDRDARYVVELREGTAKSLRMGIGDKFRL
ncbi:MAG: DUF192 domain-containing protein [Candidatus Marsarchaeota archaeon]|nr:DUF192 domain-containing protein [Candidatus Marsarchaeota archaeon]MCL5412903.1 DUF192 domain-containing protein [Candidatus Marsarchaeota archaeon]